MNTDTTTEIDRAMAEYDRAHRTPRWAIWMPAVAIVGALWLPALAIGAALWMII